MLGLLKSRRRRRIFKGAKRPGVSEANVSNKDFRAGGVAFIDRRREAPEGCRLDSVFKRF